MTMSPATSPDRPWPLWRVMPASGAWVTAPAMARGDLEVTLVGWEVPAGDPLRDIGALLVSELATNAVNAAAGRAHVLQLRLFSDIRRLLIEVWDTAPGWPRRAPGNPASTSGRGLALIDYYSDQRWGCTGRPGDKVTWCLLDRTRLKELDA
jgi:hypothetical protein